MCSLGFNDAIICGTAKGVAICSPDDNFNADIGTQIACARAESNAYTNAAKRLSKRLNYLRKTTFDLDMICADFELKRRKIVIHNKEYIDELY